MLRDKMPSFYSESGMMLQLFEVEDTEIQDLEKSIQNTFDEFFIDTAKATIDRWEKEVGVPKSSLPIEQRRATVKSKLRGYGTVNVDHIKTICDSYTNGDVSIIEKPSTYEFEVKFNSVRGIPPNMKDLQNIINQIKPAHLGVTYIYLYTTWDRFDSFNYTWDEFDSLNKTWDELEVM
ncbi:putative phage tail protein [Bacillus sp. AFS040349]|uniref:putative phage tail protein n=1 Tax=Bacillus sp. AFS040349 TaxID=2033502 RepID=UPI000BFBCFA0|nr:putative phage tail protein [Bacillus sp. AFS040349]PGT89223.1 phage portal protein [Bacillus sp. AFS040349]